MTARIMVGCLLVGLFSGPSWCNGAETIRSRRTIRLEPVGGREYPPVITAIAVHPDGDLIAAAGDDHAIRLLSGNNFATQRVIGNHQDWVRSLDFSPDGKLLLSAGNDGRIQIWEQSGKWENHRDFPGGPALACAKFSANGRRVAAVGFDSQIFLLQLGKAPKLNITCDCRDLRTVLFAHEDRILAVGGRSGELHLFDPDSGERRAAISLHVGRLRDCAPVPGTSLIATVGEDSRCAFVDLEVMDKVGEAMVSGCKLLSVAGVDSRHVAVGGSDNLIRIIDVRSGQVTHKLMGHHGSVAVLKASEDFLVSGSFDTSIRFWDLDDIQPRETVATIRTSDASNKDSGSDNR